MDFFLRSNLKSYLLTFLFFLAVFRFSFSNLAQKTAVFCYGSNSIQQLRERIKNPDVSSYGCFAPHYRRIYCGHSYRWGGGTASIASTDEKDELCFGTVVFLSDEELTRLDRFEGIVEGNNPFNDDPNVNVYRREWIEIVMQGSEEKSRAIAYIRNDHTWESYPSEKYLQACYRNVAPFWPDFDGEGWLKVYDESGHLKGEYKP